MRGNRVVIMLAISSVLPVLGASSATAHASASHVSRQTAAVDASPGGTTSLISVSTSGVQSDQPSWSAVTSADGRIVVFCSEGQNLDPASPRPSDEDGGVFVRDTVAGTTHRVDVGPDDEACDGHLALSANGRWLALSERTHGNSFVPTAYQAMLVDLTTGTETTISAPPDADSQDTEIDSVAISDDGTTVVYAGLDRDQAGWQRSLWEYDRVSAAKRDLLAAPVEPPANGPWDPGAISLSEDGTVVAFVQNDRVLETMDLAAGGPPTPVMTDNGDPPNRAGYIVQHSLSADGRYMAFTSWASNWVTPDTTLNLQGANLFVLDRLTGKVQQETADLGPDTAAVNGLSEDGSEVLFDSTSPLLVPGDTNDSSDLFLMDLATGAVNRLTEGPDGEQALSYSTGGYLSADGQHVSFVSPVSTYVYDDTNHNQDVFEMTLNGAPSTNLAATVASHRVALAWRSPSASDRVVVREAAGRIPPACATCGRPVYSGRGRHAVVHRLRNHQVYSYSVFTRSASGRLISRKTTSAKPIAVRRHVGSDFRDNGLYDPAVFSPRTGTWTIHGFTRTVHFGRAGDIAVPADYDGDGRTDLAVFRPSTGNWLIAGHRPVHFGRHGDIPVPADYNGDGRADLAVFRPATGQWIVMGRKPVQLGRRGDIPVPADYRAGGSAQMAVFRPSTGRWFIDGAPGIRFGRRGDIPVPADYAGKGRVQLAVFRPSTGRWQVQGQPSIVFGHRGDWPVAGDANGDGRADPMIYRPTTGRWSIDGVGSHVLTIGGRGDRPV